MDELPKLAEALHLFLGASPKTALHSRVRNTPNPRCPLDLRVDALLGEVEDVIDRTDKLRVADLILQPKMPFIIWLNDVRKERELDGCQRALDVGRVHRKVNDVLGFDLVKQKRHAPCPECGERELFNWIGESHVQCKCKYVMSLDEYQDYCVELLEEMNK